VDARNKSGHDGTELLLLMITFSVRKILLKPMTKLQRRAQHHFTISRDLPRDGQATCYASEMTMVMSMPAQMYFMELARRCRFLSCHTLDLRIAKELRILGEELEDKARTEQIAADAAAPAMVQAYAPRQI
jgi:hypothetical protein